jgi:hypothetical protein
MSQVVLEEVVLENVLPQIDALNMKDLRRLQRIIDAKLHAADEPEKPAFRETSAFPPGFVPRIIGESPRTLRDRSREWAWLRDFGHEYAGQWVALDGDKLIASGPTLQEVAEAAEAAGVKDALTVRPEPRDALPYAGM